MSERTYYSEEAEQREQRKKTALTMFASMVGAGFGAVAGILFAPRRGEETRQKIAERVGQTVEQGREEISHNLDKGVNNLREKSQALQSSATEQVEEVVQSSRKKINEKVEKLQSDAADLQDEVKKRVPFNDA